jgi:hypothetical protein
MLSCDGNGSESFRAELMNAYTVMIMTDQHGMQPSTKRPTLGRETGQRFTIKHLKKFPPGTQASSDFFQFARRNYRIGTRELFTRPRTIVVVAVVLFSVAV